MCQDKAIRAARRTGNGADLIGMKSSVAEPLYCLIPGTKYEIMRHRMSVPVSYTADNELVLLRYENFAEAVTYPVSIP